PTHESLRDVVDLSGSLSDVSERVARIVERLKIEDALQRTTSRAEAAELLGIAPRTLAAKMKELGLE
ncbi:MAG TPA: helix-turn-helix domain-containing protein, partial [Thermoanaerobaculia bacterium]|nr:helix-turn-helix domain-containing protein [Thermoanaerobaculia bacterium]